MKYKNIPNKHTSNIDTIPNIQVKNKFEVLQEDITGTSQDADNMEYQEEPPMDEFKKYLKKKNNKVITNTKTKKDTQTPTQDHSTAAEQSPTHEWDSDEPKTQTQTQKMSQVKTRRQDRPPPINILDQDPKDTTTLMETTLDIVSNSFYIKRTAVSTRYM